MPIYPKFSSAFLNPCVETTQKTICLPYVHIISGWHMFSEESLGWLKHVKQLEVRGGGGCFDDWTGDSGRGWTQSWGGPPPQQWGGPAQTPTGWAAPPPPPQGGFTPAPPRASPPSGGFDARRAVHKEPQPPLLTPSDLAPGGFDPRRAVNPQQSPRGQPEQAWGNERVPDSIDPAVRGRPDSGYSGPPSG